MTIPQNPFDPADHDRHALWETHLRGDIAAFLRSDWPAVADDFDAESFVAIDARQSAAPGDWTIGFPDLDTYRDTWLRMSRETLARADPEKVAAALYVGCTITRIDLHGDTALLHKHFDGALPLRDGSTEPYRWQTVFTLRKRQGAWKIVSFVGYMPAD